MSKTKNQSKPQLKLGLGYSGSKFFQFISYRIKRYVVLLEQFSYWRSPLVWLLIFLNVVFSYAIISFSSSAHSLPPEISLFHYAGRLQDILFDSSLIPILVVIFGLIQFIVLLISSHIHYKLRDLSQFILAISVLLTILFFLSLYKSISVTLPIST